MSRLKVHTKSIIKTLILMGLSAFLIVVGLGALWFATLKMPDLQSFENRKVIESTKIYDRTGLLLYDTGINIRRTSVKLNEISPYIQKGAIAIEDSGFYSNIGIEPISIIRAVLANFMSREYAQGASTITQQVVKNAILTQDKTLSRKFKEWVLSVKLTRILPKDDILTMYLNESPWGGTIYGVEEASMTFFGLPAKNVSLAQAAYLAAIPQAPTYYSPYGSHREALDARQHLVLARMKTLGFITQAEYDQALTEKVQFISKNESGIRAPHFVMFVRELLIQKYGEDAILNGGLRVTTSLDYELQQTAQDTVNKFAKSLETNYHASNTAMVAIDPKNGDILTMIGSRDYFDEKIDGNYNITLAKRQPGSTFKPFVYATAFKEGYTPETVLFDVKTEFSTRCTVEGKPKNPGDDIKNCYSPGEYDDKYEGPMTIREALAHSRNIPAVQALYLTGINDSIQTAEDLGITSLNDPNRYGLTLVLGGGEVSLLDLTSAYGVFANDGMRNPYRAVLKVEDGDGNILEEVSATTSPSVVLAPEVARQITDILSDNSVRMASLKPVAEGVGRPVAIKTGTTNDFRDVWAVGYTPNLVVGAWAGKNDNSPLEHNVAGLIIAPVWGAFMSQAVRQLELPVETFKAPPSPLAGGKPVLRGIWYGGQSYTVDTISGKVATEFTPQETRKEIVFNSVHNILHWVNKNDPQGDAPLNPSADSQYEYWEYAVRKWFETEYKPNNPTFVESTSIVIPTETDNVHLPTQAPQVSFESPASGASIDPKIPLTLRLKYTATNPAKKTDIYLNGKFIVSNETDPLNITFTPADYDATVGSNNTIYATVYDSVLNRGQAHVQVNFTQ